LLLGLLLERLLLLLGLLHPLLGRLLGGLLLPLDLLGEILQHAELLRLGALRFLRRTFHLSACVSIDHNLLLTKASLQTSLCTRLRSPRTSSQNCRGSESTTSATVPYLPSSSRYP
jgi:hypothetical protein